MIFKGLNTGLKRLSNADSIEMHNSIYALIENAKIDLFDKIMLSYKSQLELLNWKNNPKNGNSEIKNASAINKKRRLIWARSKAFIKGISKSLDEKVSKNAKIIFDLMNKYGNIYIMKESFVENAYDGLLKQFEKLEEEVFVCTAFDSWKIELEKIEQEYKDALDKKEKERIKNKQTKFKDLKEKCLEIYTKIINVLVGIYSLNEEKEYEILLLNIEKIIKKFKRK